MANKFVIKTTSPKIVVTTCPETKIDVTVNKPIINTKVSKSYFKLKNTGGPRGEKGDKGDTGTAATITAGATSTLPAGSSATVTNVGTSSAAVLNFGIPKGDKGDKGDTGSAGAAATVTVGTTTTGNPGTNASVTNVGTSSAAVLNFTIPKGAKGDTGATGAPGSPGAAATVAVGTTTTGAAGTSASVTNSGTSSAAVLNFTIPKGDKGDTGNPGSAATISVGTVTTGAPTDPASVVNTGTSSAAVFDFVIPKGDKGDSGSGAGDMLSADYDPNGTVKTDGGIEAYVSSVLPTKTSDLLNDGSDGTAEYLETDETAYRASGIPYGAVDNTSTSTAYTATVPGITSLYDGVCMWLKNGVVSSASGFTIDINNLGAKPVYSNMSAAYAESTMFNVNYTFMFVYDSTRVAGGCWMLNRGYNSDTNTIGYLIRTNSQALPASNAFVRYRLLFTSADGTKYVPATTSTYINATSTRTVNQTKINPFGRILYYGSTAIVSAGNIPGVSVLWEQYAFALGYSFNRTGAALTLTSWKPVYIKCTPQSDGSAIIDSTTPYVQDLPTTDDGKIYIFLGVAYSATNVELQLDHPVYYFKNGHIRLYTGAPTKTSELDNDSGFLTSSTAVTSFNGSTGAITYTAPVTSVNGSTGAVTINVPTNTSDLTNDSGFLTSSDAVILDDTIMNTNPFGGRKLYINSIDNALASADKKYYVTVTTHLKEISGVTYPYVKSGASVTDDEYWVDSPVVSTLDSRNIFDGNYETSLTIPSGHYAKIHIQFNDSASWTPSTGSAFSGYPYGTYYLSYYYSEQPESAQLRTYNKYAAHTLGWKLADFTDYKSSATELIQQLEDDRNYQRSCLEFLVFSKDSAVAKLTQIDWKLQRPNLSNNGSTVTKFGSQKLYHTFSWGDQTTNKVVINPSGTVTATTFSGNATSATKAGQDGNGANIASTYAKKTEIPTVNNATLTIQQNGTDVQTFTANQSTDATANITVPTKTSDLTNTGSDGASSYISTGDTGTVSTAMIADDAITPAKIDYSTYGKFSRDMGPTASQSYTANTAADAKFAHAIMTEVGCTYDTSTGEFTISQAGYWQINAAVRTSYGSSANYGTARIQINSTNVAIGSGTGYASSSANGVSYATPSWFGHLAVGDKVKVNITPFLAITNGSGTAYHQVINGCCVMPD